MKQLKFFLVVFAFSGVAAFGQNHLISADELAGQLTDVIVLSWRKTFGARSTKIRIMLMAE
jgi:hypothetical protein